MKYTLHDLVPGSKWIQEDSKIITEVVRGPHCPVEICYGYYQYRNKPPITKPQYLGQPPLKVITFHRHYPFVLIKYLQCDDPKYLNKITSVHANNFLYYSQPLETNV